MTTIDLQELSPSIAEAVKQALASGEEVFITENQKERLARVVSFSESTSPSGAVEKRGLFGCMKGVVTYMADDFNEPLEDLKEYMPE